MKKFKLLSEDVQRMDKESLKEYINGMYNYLTMLNSPNGKEHRKVLFECIKSVKVIIDNNPSLNHYILSHFKDDRFIERIGKKRFSKGEILILKGDFTDLLHRHQWG